MALSEFQQASRDHIKRLATLTDKRAIPKLRKLYDEAHADLERKLAKAVSSKSSPFTIQQHKVMLAQVKEAQINLARQLGSGLGQATIETQTASLNALIKEIKKLEKAHSGAVVQLPIEQAARFTGVIDKRATSLLALNKKSMAQYGARVVTKMENALAQTLVQGETGHKAIERIMKTADVEWWQAERIVRTEQAWAYNATQADAIVDSSSKFPDMMMRWTELVEDVTLRKLDERVGDDSVAMHGQLAKPGGVFMIPPGAQGKISPSMKTQSWTNPPNRPNDRSVLQPWRPGWGWGWELVNGTKVVR